MKTKIALLVGATQGIGRQTAHLLAAAGYRVVLVGRNRSAGEALAAQLDGVFIRADVSLMSEVYRVADAVRNEVQALDVIVHSADTLATRRQETAEGFEQSLATNYLSRSLLNHRLLDLLRKGDQPRIVHVAAANLPLTLTPTNFPLPKQASSFTGHNVGHAANDYYGFGFTERYGREGIRINILNPGLVDTDIRRRGNGGLFVKAFIGLMEVLMRPFTVAPEAYAPLVAAIATGRHPAADQAILIDRKGRPLKPRPDRLNGPMQEYIWQQSEQLTGITATQTTFS